MKEDKYKIKTGSYPVIISAPHGHDHFRPGFESDPKPAERFTLDLAEKLAREGEYSLIATISNQRHDPNWYPDSSYRKDLLNHALTEKITLLLDIHGLAVEEESFLKLYYNQGDLKAEELAKKIIDNVSPHYNGKAALKRFMKNEQLTICEELYLSHGISCIEVEVNHRIGGSKIERKYLTDIFKSAISEFLSR